jgi:hypothetical protein
MGAVGGLAEGGAVGIGGLCIPGGALTGGPMGGAPEDCPGPGGIFGKGGNLGAAGAPGGPDGAIGGPPFGAVGGPVGGPPFAAVGGPVGGPPGLVGKLVKPESFSFSLPSAFAAVPPFGIIVNNKLAAFCFESFFPFPGGADTSGNESLSSAFSSNALSCEGLIFLRSSLAFLILFLNSLIALRVSSIVVSIEAKLFHKKSNKFVSLSLTISFPLESSFLLTIC